MLWRTGTDYQPDNITNSRNYRLISDGLGALDGADQDMCVAAFHARRRLDGPVRGQILGEADEQLFTEVRMRNLASAKLNDGLDAVAFLQEPHGVALLELVI